MNLSRSAQSLQCNNTSSLFFKKSISINTDTRAAWYPALFTWNTADSGSGNYLGLKIKNGTQNVRNIFTEENVHTK